MTINLA